MRLAIVFRSFVLLVLTSCSSLAIAASPIDALNHARTLIVVTTADWDSTQARLRTFTRVDGKWQPAAQSFAVALGRHGSAWGEGLHPAQMQGPQSAKAMAAALPASSPLARRSAMRRRSTARCRTRR